MEFIYPSTLPDWYWELKGFKDEFKEGRILNENVDIEVCMSRADDAVEEKI